MRKRIIGSDDSIEHSCNPKWMDIEEIALVEVTSEDPEHPVELGLSREKAGEWRASGPGEQIIRLIFDNPQRIRLMSLKFVESEIQRTQQFEIAFSVEEAGNFQHLVRQQWNFAPENGSSTEVENYHCSIEHASALELRIIPDISGGMARASLQQWKIAS